MNTTKQNEKQTIRDPCATCKKAPCCYPYGECWVCINKTIKRHKRLLNGGVTS